MLHIQLKTNFCLYTLCVTLSKPAKSAKQDLKNDIANLHIFHYIFFPEIKKTNTACVCHANEQGIKSMKKKEYLCKKYCPDQLCHAPKELKKKEKR
jgi:hypothetical protein